MSANINYQIPGISTPPPACTLHKDHNMATANENINENIVAVEDLKIYRDL